jgi:GTPase SAR1 family protein
MMNSNNPIKVVFVGNAKTGKSRAVSRLLGSFKGAMTPYAPTYGAEVFHYTNAHGSHFDIWDCAGNKECGGLRDGYFVGADICVVFGHNQYEWVRDVQRVSENVITYVFNTNAQLKLMLESIADDRSPKGHVTDEEITVINVLN